MGAAHEHRFGAFDVVGIDVAFVEGAVGAILAVEDERKGLFVADAQQHERSKADWIGSDAGNIDALARALFADEPPHMLVADAGYETAFQTKPRGANGDVRWATADSLGEARHVLEAPAHLRAIEVDR